MTNFQSLCALRILMQYRSMRRSFDHWSVIVTVWGSADAWMASLRFYHTRTPIFPGSILYPVRLRRQIQLAGDLSVHVRTTSVLDTNIITTDRTGLPKELTSTSTSSLFLFRASHSKQSINK